MTKTRTPTLIGLLLALPIVTGLTLPSRGPLPQMRPEVATPAPDAEAKANDGAQASAPLEAPTPQSKPETAADAEEGTEPSRPAETEAAKDKASEETKPDGDEQKAAPLDPPPPVEDPKALAACLAELKALGARFETDKAIDDADGCGISAPITLTRLLPDVALEPEATLRCETALQLARMTRDMLKPAAEAAFPDKPKLAAIRHASGYVCRNRNSVETGKVSEHAYGNAIDIAGLRFGNDDMAVMIASQDNGTAEAAFQRAFNAIACLYFTTVLSPGSDATHQDHMHLDVIKRKSGFRYCR
ncbi:MAG: extensin family protein [Alphaproteobacteria bacterium]|nr:extensin family protein [Alphaproteobacteria bacterium]MBU0833015.1 extensin family protein [Alphaproteobacteria bacterium]MBU1764515.1 extensin family protein [Alphaproteobacteria bacterium]